MNGVRSAVAFLSPAPPRLVPVSFFAWAPSAGLPAFRFRGGARYGPRVGSNVLGASATHGTARPPSSCCFLLAFFILLAGRGFSFPFFFGFLSCRVLVIFKRWDCGWTIDLQASIWRNSSPPLLIVSPSFSHGLSTLTLGEEGFEIPPVQNLYLFVRNGLEIVYVMLRLKNRCV